MSRNIFAILVALSWGFSSEALCSNLQLYFGGASDELPIPVITELADGISSSDQRVKATTSFFGMSLLFGSEHFRYGLMVRHVQMEQEKKTADFGMVEIEYYDTLYHYTSVDGMQFGPEFNFVLSTKTEFQPYFLGNMYIGNYRAEIGPTYFTGEEYKLKMEDIGYAGAIGIKWQTKVKPLQLFCDIGGGQHIMKLKSLKTPTGANVSNKFDKNTGFKAAQVILRLGIDFNF